MTQIVSIWTEIQRSGNAGPDEAPTLSTGAPAIITQLLDCLVSIGVQPHVVSGESNADSPLLTVAHTKDLPLVQWMVRQRVNVNAVVSEDDPFTALHAAVSTRVEM